MKTNSRPWTKGEKAIVVGVVIFLAVATASAMWMNSVDTVPLVNVPTPTMPSPNGFDYMVAASKSAVEGWPMRGNAPPGPIGTIKDLDLSDPKVKAAADALILQNKGALSAVHQSLSFPYETPPLWSFTQPVPYLAKFRGLARVIAFQAQVDGHRGDYHGAAASSLQAIEIGDRIPRGGDLIHSLVGQACEAIGRKPLWVDIGKLDAADCRLVVKTLDNVDTHRTAYVEVLTQEKWLGESGLQEIFRSPNWKSSLTSLAGNTSNPQQIQMAFRNSMIGKRQVMADYISHMDAAIAAAKEPYGTKAASTPTDLISDVLIVDDDLARFRLTFGETEDKLLMTACALRAYELVHHGQYPSTLAQLVPTYLPSVPLDPFAASSPLVYRRTCAVYALYSIGPDGHDDKGVAVYDPSQTARAHTVDVTSKGDIVAGLNL